MRMLFLLFIVLVSSNAIFGADDPAQKQSGGGEERALTALDKRIAELDAAIAREPSMAEAYFQRGKVRERREEWKLALGDFETALALEPTNWRFVASHACAMGITGKRVGAAAEFKDAFKLKPDSPEIYELRGRLHLHFGENDKAIADYSEAIRLAPDKADYYVARAAVRRLEQDREAARADLDEAIRLDPKNADYLVDRADFWWEQGKTAEGLDDLNKAIKIDPQSTRALKKRSDFWHRSSDWEKAIADLDEVIRLDPNDSAAFAHRALARDQKGDFEKAYADYGEAVRLDPKNLLFRFRRIAMARERKDWTTANTDVDELFRLFPNRDVFWPGYVTEVSANGISSPWSDRRSAELLGAFSDACDFQPATAKGFALRARLRQLDSPFGEIRAIEDYEAAIRLDPKNEDYKKQKAQLESEIVSARGRQFLPGRSSGARKRPPGADEQLGARDK